MKPTTRVTLRLSDQDLHAIDTFVKAGEYSNRSEVIRRAVKDFVRANFTDVKESLTANAELHTAYVEMQELQAQIEDMERVLATLAKR